MSNHVSRTKIDNHGKRFFPSRFPKHFLSPLLTHFSCSTKSDDDIVLRVLQTVARLHGECLILGDFNAPHFNWLTRSCSMANSFSNKLLTAADEEFLHQAATSPTRYRTGQLPSMLDLVFSKYSSSIHSINHLAPLGKSDHATLQVNFAASGLPAGNISKPKWRYNKASVQVLLCAADDVKMVIRRSQSMNLRRSLTAAWDWSKKWCLPFNPTKCNYLIIGREVPLRLSFFPDGSGTPIPVSTLVKDLGVQTDNMFSPSVRCNEAANEARRLIFIIRLSFENLSKSAFIRFYGVLSASTSRMWYVSLFTKPRCRYLPSSANSKVSSTVGNWHA